MNIDKDLLLKDLCARLPYRVKVQFSYIDTSPAILKGIDNELIICEIAVGELEDVKPYLFPLSSMTEEQRNELESLMEVINIPVWGDILTPSTEYYDWLNRNHFDYRGLIEKGLAIEINKSNNPYKK